MHEGAGGQLEVLDDAPREHQPLRWLGRIHESGRVADHVEAFVVERLRRQLGLAVVTLHHDRAADAQLELAADGHELEIDARVRQSDQADALGVPVGRGRGRRGLGAAPAGDHHDAPAGVADGERLQAAVQVVGQRRAAVAHQPQAREEVGGERLVGLERGGEHRPGRRHVAHVGRRDLVQVAHGLVELTRHRPAIVDVQRAAVGQHRVEQRVATHGVVPGQPVEQVRRRIGRIARPALQVHHQVRAHHALRVRHGLRHAGGAGGEQQLADGLGADAGQALGDRSGRTRGSQRVPGQARHAGGGALDVDDGHARQVERGQRAVEGRAVLHEHQAGPHQLEHVAQLRVVAAHQRVGGRDRRGRRADLHRGHRQQRMLERVGRQDHHRPIGTEATVDQRLRDGVDGGEALAVGHAPPRALGAAPLREPGALGRLGAPAAQQARHVVRVRVQRHPRAHDDRAVVATIDLDVALGPGDVAERRQRRVHRVAPMKPNRWPATLRIWISSEPSVIR